MRTERTITLTLDRCDECGTTLMQEERWASGFYLKDWGYPHLPSCSRASAQTEGTEDDE